MSAGGPNAHRHFVHRSAQTAVESGPDSLWWRLFVGFGVLHAAWQQHE
jgi:hypothetical protein